MSSSLDNFFKQTEEVLRNVFGDSLPIENDYEITKDDSMYKREKTVTNWISIVLLSGKEILMILKIFYNIDEIKNIDYFKENEKGSDFINDFFKEICNIIAGNLNRMVDQADIAVEQSLPLNLLGFDNLFLEKYASLPLSEYHGWKLFSPSQRITWLVSLDVYTANEEIFEILNTKGSQKKGDVIEFL